MPWSPETQQLIQAIEANDLNAVNQHIATLKKTAIGLEEKHNNGDTPLILASRIGRTEIVRALISNGADMNQTNNNGFTPLLLASGYSQTETALALLEAGATANQMLCHTLNQRIPNLNLEWQETEPNSGIFYKKDARFKPGEIQEMLKAPARQLKAATALPLPLSENTTFDSPIATRVLQEVAGLTDQNEPTIHQVFHALTPLHSVSQGWRTVLQSYEQHAKYPTSSWSQAIAGEVKERMQVGQINQL